MGSGVYNEFKGELMKGTFNLVQGNDVVYCALLDNIHSFDADDNGWAALVANELANGNGYATNGFALTNKAVTIDDGDDEGVFDADDAEWTSATFTAYHAVIWDDTPGAPVDPVICSIDFLGPKQVTAGTFTIEWDVEGIININ